MRFLTALILFVLFLPARAYAGDAATVVFKSGQVVMIEDGYRQIVDAMKTYGSGGKNQPRIMELNINGGSFLLKVSEVVIVCRDDCRGLTVRHQLDPARGKRSSE